MKYLKLFLIMFLIILNLFQFISILSTQEQVKEVNNALMQLRDKCVYGLPKGISLEPAPRMGDIVTEVRPTPVVIGVATAGESARLK